jgi:hypothetical protein
MFAEVLGHHLPAEDFCDFDEPVFDGDFGMPEERRPDVVRRRRFGSRGVYREFESLSLRQDTLGRHSLCPAIRPEKPRKSAIFGGRVCTLGWGWKVEISL